MKYKQKLICYKKRKYATSDQAYTHIKEVYFKYGIMLSLYECPNCLDFHLTKKKNDTILKQSELYKNLRLHAIRRWFPHWKRKTGLQLVQERMKAMRKMQPILPGMKLEKLSGTKKENRLSLADQKAILAQL